METIKQKKGIQLNQAFGAVLTLVLLGVLVIIAIFMFSSLGSTFVSSPISISNENFTVTNAGTALINASDCNFGNFAVLVVTNASNTVLNPANYSASTSGTIRNITSAVPYGTAWRANYTYTNGGQACTASQVTTTQFGNYPALVGLVGTIIFLGIVIGVLVASFAFGGRRGA